MGGAVERAEPGAGVDHSRPAVREPDALELRERRGEVPGQGLEGLGPVVVTGVDRAAVVVDRVVPAPQDPAVRGEPVVVELVAGVGDPDARVPPQCRELLLGERLGRQHVVIDRHHPPGVAAQRPGEDVGREHHVLRPHHSPAGGRRDPVARLLQRLEAGALGDAHAQLLGRVGQSPRQPGRVDHRRLVRVEPAGEVRRRGHQLLDGRRVEEAGDLRLQACDLVRAGRHGELPAPRPSAVDAVAPQRLLDLVEVAHPELVHHVVLVGPPLPAVGLAVRQARLAEATVAPGRVLGEPVGLDEQHPPARLPLDRTQGRPESREPATHDQQVGVDGVRRAPAAAPAARGCPATAAAAPEPARGHADAWPVAATQVSEDVVAVPGTTFAWISRVSSAIIARQVGVGVQLLLLRHEVVVGLELLEHRLTVLPDHHERRQEDRLQRHHERQRRPGAALGKEHPRSEGHHVQVDEVHRAGELGDRVREPELHVLGPLGQDVRHHRVMRRVASGDVVMQQSVTLRPRPTGSAPRRARRSPGWTSRRARARCGRTALRRTR